MATPSLSEIMKKAKEMQSRMLEAQNELSKIEITGKAGAGLVEVVLNGKYYAKKVILSAEALKESKEVLQDLIAAAINDACRKVEKNSQQAIVDLTKQMGLPEDLKLPDDDDE